MVWFKRLGYLIGALVALIMAAVVYILVFVDPNQFKGQLTQVAKEQANVSLRLDGDISWSFFPWLGLSLENIGVAMGDAPEVVSFDKAEFSLAVMPLLQQSIEVEKVRLIGLNADLKVAADGTPNWLPPVTNTPAETNAGATTAEATGAEQSSSVAPTENTDAPGALTLPQIALDELLIQNATISYTDASADLKAKATANLTLTNVRWDQAWPMLLDVTVEQSNLTGQNPIKANVALSSNLTVFPERQALSLAKLEVKSSVNMEALPVQPLDALLEVASLDLDLPQENLQVEGLSLSALGINADIQAEVYQFLTAPEFSAVVSVAEFSPKALLGKLNIELPEMADETVLQKASLNLSAKGNLDTVKVQPISLALDDTEIEANALLHLNPLSWDVKVAGANLDVDRYLPPVVEGVEEDVAAVPTQENAEAPAGDLIPVELVKTLNGHFGFIFDTLKVKNVSIDRIELDSNQRDGVVTINPAKVTLYDGDVSLQAKLDVNGSEPRIDISPAMNGVQIQPLLNDFMELDKIAGATYLQGDMYTTGNSVDAFMKQLNGDLLVEIKSGALVGMNLTQSVCEGIAASRARTIDKSLYGADTPFETMQFPARIVNGEVSTPGLEISAVGVEVTGDGVVSLPNSSLNYTARVGVSGSQVDPACSVKSNVQALKFPVVCKGKFSDDPVGLCRPDIAGFGKIFTDLAKAELDAKLAAEKAALQAKLEAEKAAAQAKLDAEKAAAQAKLEAEKARAEAKLAEEKARLQAELEAKKKAEEEALKQKAEDKLKSALKGLF
ncbi:AsmA family protein [Maribrevibacterium harenarium]|uniref:AsmA family protein n=1 Tax=Maribrevibacterium harenarium TaxID=2589817 RepID=A0A501X091_9GAMM|nr:AsmA family protein [Maribrevibacterium harenarium]TPE54315.1 AsmA family protein [Maribrevibacterium harenarium]